jgi:hypothetical protein
MVIIIIIIIIIVPFVNYASCLFCAYNVCFARIIKGTLNRIITCFIRVCDKTAVSLEPRRRIIFEACLSCLFDDMDFI